MNVIFGVENLTNNFSNAVICIGNFDGIHYGHRQIITTCIREAKKINTKSLLVTFDKHPRNVFAELKNGPPLPILTTNEEKTILLEDTGIDGILFLETDPDFLSVGPEEFLKQVIVDKIGASQVIVGYDFRFGKARLGNVELMQQCGKKYQFNVVQAEAVRVNGEIVSSSGIRNYLKQGNLAAAEQALGYQYHFSGRVIHGSGRGTMMGFPTANIEIDNPRKLVPARGIYLTRVVIDGRDKFGLCNIGVRPTFGESDLVIEIFIYHEKNVNLYNLPIEVTLLHRMRDEIKYDSQDALIEQMRIDKQNGLELIKQYN